MFVTSALPRTVIPCLMVVASAAPAETARGGDLVPGVLVRLYEIDEAVRDLPSVVPGEKPNVAKVVPAIDLRGERGDFDPVGAPFVTEVRGLIALPATGTYAFRLISDDGSRLWIEDRLIIEHDGLHGPVPKDATVQLRAGQHVLRIDHFDAGGGKDLALLWRPPGAPAGAEFASLPAEALLHDSALSRETAPGKKRVIVAPRRGLPGDGSPVVGMHPAFHAEPLSKTNSSPREREEALGAVYETLRWMTPAPGDQFLFMSGSVALRQMDDPKSSSVLNGATLARLPVAAGVTQAGIAGRVGGGPYSGQIIIPDVATGTAVRLFVDDRRDEGAYQGCVFRFARLSEEGVAIATGWEDRLLTTPCVLLSEEHQESSPTARPRRYGFAWPSAIKDLESSRWIHAWEERERALQSITMIEPLREGPFEMLAVRAMNNGLEIEFTQPLDRRVGWDPESYAVEQWPIVRSERGIEEVIGRDGSRAAVRSASVSADRRRVFLEITNLATDRLIYLRLLPPCISEKGGRPWTTEAWYTMEHIPRERAGEALPRPSEPPRNVLTDEERSAGWRLLFDGRTTAGWRGFRKEDMSSGWQVVDGCLVRVGPGGDIVTTETFGSFELQIDWRVSAGGNSGVFFHVTEEHPTVWLSGPEMQILDNAEHVDGKAAVTSAGANYALHAPPRDVTEPVGLFNRARLVVRGDKVEHWLNGVKIVEYELGGDDWKARVAGSKFATMPAYGRSPGGHVALQDHGDKVWFRNIKVRPLPE